MSVSRKDLAPIQDYLLSSNVPIKIVNEIMDKLYEEYVQFDKETSDSAEAIKIIKDKYNIFISLEPSILVGAGMVARILKNEEKFNIVLDQVIKMSVPLDQRIPPNGKTLFHVVTEEGFCQSMKKMMSDKKQIKLDNYNNTPLFIAISKFVGESDAAKKSVYEEMIDMLGRHLSFNDFISLHSCINVLEMPGDIKKSHDTMFMVYEKILNLQLHNYFSRKFKVLLGAEYDLKLSYDNRDQNMGPISIIIIDIDKIMKKVSLNEINFTNDRDDNSAENIILKLQEYIRQIVRFGYSPIPSELATVINTANLLIDLIETNQIIYLRKLEKIEKADALELQKLRYEVGKIDQHQILKNEYSEDSEILVTKLILLLNRIQGKYENQSNMVVVEEIQKEKSQVYSLLGNIISMKGTIDPGPVEIKVSKNDLTNNNCLLAYEAIEYARQFILQGFTIHASVSPYVTTKLLEFKNGINDVRDMRFDEKKIETRLLHEHAIRLDPDQNIFQLEYNIGLYKKFSIGNCAEYAFLALDYIATYNANKKGQVIAKMYRIQGGDHVFLVIGEKVGKEKDKKTDSTSALNPMNWSDDTYICDPWSKLVYKAIEYKNYLKNYHFRDIDHIVHPLTPEQSLCLVYKTTADFSHRSDSVYINKMFLLFQEKIKILNDVIESLLSNLNKMELDVSVLCKKRTDHPLYKFILKKNKLAVSAKKQLKIDKEIKLGDLLQEKIKLRLPDVSYYTYIKDVCQGKLSACINRAWKIANISITEELELNLLSEELDLALLKHLNKSSVGSFLFLGDIVKRGIDLLAIAKLKGVSDNPKDYVLLPTLPESEKVPNFKERGGYEVSPASILRSNITIPTRQADVRKNNREKNVETLFPSSLASPRSATSPASPAAPTPPVSSGSSAPPISSTSSVSPASPLKTSSINNLRKG